MFGLAVLAALLVAALVQELRLPLLIVLGALQLRSSQGSTLSWASAAALPVAFILAWGALVGSGAKPDLLDCGNLLSTAALGRVGEMLFVVGLIVVIARRLGSDVRALGLGRPTRLEVTFGGLAVAIIPLAGLAIGSTLAEPFFGPIRLHLSEPVAIVPALTVAISNGVVEELAYRGALLSWLTRVLDWRVALAGQAIVFGAAHTGSDYVASALPVVLAVTVGGLVAGLIVRRTGSLWLPIVVHACLDVPLYYAAVCRSSWPT